MGYASVYTCILLSFALLCCIWSRWERKAEIHSMFQIVIVQTQADVFADRLDALVSFCAVLQKVYPCLYSCMQLYSFQIQPSSTIVGLCPCFHLALLERCRGSFRLANFHTRLYLSPWFPVPASCQRRTRRGLHAHGSDEKEEIKSITFCRLEKQTHADLPFCI